MNNKIFEKHPDWWFEVERNGITKMWLVRLAEYPSSNKQHLEDNTIFLEVGETFEEAVDMLLVSMDE